MRQPAVYRQSAVGLALPGRLPTLVRLFRASGVEELCRRRGELCASRRKATCSWRAAMRSSRRKRQWSRRNRSASAPATSATSWRTTRRTATCLGCPNTSSPSVCCASAIRPGTDERPMTSRYDRKFIVFPDRYRRLDEAELMRNVIGTCKNGLPGIRIHLCGIENIGQAMYVRKFAVEFSVEILNCNLCKLSSATGSDRDFNSLSCACVSR